MDLLPALLVPVLLVLVLGLWVSWTARRLTRLRTRVDTARLSLEVQLVRRAAAAEALAGAAVDRLGPDVAARLHEVARTSVSTADPGREAIENDLSRLLADLPAGMPEDLRADLADASARVSLARRFYNDAVRDTRALRSGRVTRLSGLTRRRPAPAFFEIADPAVGARVGRIMEGLTPSEKG